MVISRGAVTRSAGKLARADLDLRRVEEFHARVADLDVAVATQFLETEMPFARATSSRLGEPIELGGKA